MHRIFWFSLVNTTLLFCQQQDRHWEALRFAELHSLQIQVAISGTTHVFNQESLHAQVFVDLQRKLPSVIIDASAQDHLYVLVHCSETRTGSSTSDPFYFCSITVALRRPAKLFLSREYYEDIQPIYWAQVWERIGAVWGKEDYVLKAAKEQIEDHVNVLAYNYSEAINELQSVLNKPAHK